MYSLLIVDDEPLIAEGIRTILAWEEYGVEICKTMTSPVEALEYIRQNGVDILITDIKMPVLDGNELIRQVKAIRPYTRIIVLSGYNDFEYVRTASLLGIENYLLKPVNLGELEKTLFNTIRRIESESQIYKEQNENRRILRENILSLWINGNLEPDVIREKLHFIGIDLSARTYSAIAIRLLGDSPAGQNTGGSAARRAEKIWFKEFFQQADDTICFCNGQDEVVLIRMGKPQAQVAAGSPSPQKIAARLHETTGCDVFVSVGPTVSDPALLGSSYAAARALANCSAYMGFHALSCTADDILGNNPVLSAEQCRILRMFAIMGDLNGAAGYIAGLLKKADTTKLPLTKLTVSWVYNLYIEIDMAHAPEKNKALALRAGLPAVECINTCKACLEAISESIDMLQKTFFSNEQSSNNYVAKMKKMAQNNFSGYLSLKTLSEEFGVSPSYLGNLFTQETGEPFSTFLNRIRIEKAKLLLIGKTEKIADISRLTGFTTVNYFHAIFKKQTGLSPAEFREQSES